MAETTVKYDINFKTNSSSVFNAIREGLKSIRDVNEIVNRSLADSWRDLITPGSNLNSKILELSATTGVTGKNLKDIESAARAVAKTFRTDAAQNIEAYKIVLTNLSPEIAKSSEAIKIIGENVNIFSKQLGGDTVTAAEILTTSMQQFGGSLNDPIEAAKMMTYLMNAMSKGSQQGSANLLQIKQALEEVGIVAKTTGVSFLETIAQIQILNQTGKKGAEGGTALRNVLVSLSEGRFATDSVSTELANAGVSVKDLANSSIPLTDRLRSLQKIQQDTALMIKIFGKENLSTAIAMIKSADKADEMAQSMGGTNSAFEKADIIMSGYNEKISNTNSLITDWKISIFNLAESYLPMIKNSMDAISSLSDFIKAVSDLNKLYETLNGLKMVEILRSKLLRVELSYLNIKMIISTTLARLKAAAFRSVAVALGQATIGATLLQIALDALGIGLIILAITSLIIGLKYLYHNSRKFHEILGYIGGAGKAIFHNIGVYANILWEIIKNIGLEIFNVYKFVWTSIWEIVESVFDSISSILIFTWDSVIKPVAIFIYETFVSVFVRIWETVKEVFNGILVVFSGFIKFISDFILSPIKNAFEDIWNWITDLLDKIFKRFDGILKPIRSLWNKIFEKEGIISIDEAGKKAAKESGEAFDNAKDNEKEAKRSNDKNFNNLLGKSLAIDNKGLPSQSIPQFGRNAGEIAKTKKSENTGSGESQKVRSLNINKLVETINIYNQNGSSLSKEAITRQVKEALLSATADFTLVE